MMTPLPRLFLAGLLLAVWPASAAEVEGVRLPEQIVVAGRTLHLNGAGVRTKFFFDIYVGALYLEHPLRRAEAVLDDAGARHVRMVFLYKEVGREKLTAGWRAGFEKNQSRRSMDALRDRLAAFNRMFGDARRGDVIDFDFLPDGETRVAVNGRERGRIEGRDFQRALLAVWLGRRPADDDLKRAMLGGD